MAYRIIIFDDNEERLNSVAMLLNLSPDFECAGTFKNCNNLVQDIKSTLPDLVINTLMRSLLLYKLFLKRMIKSSIA